MEETTMSPIKDPGYHFALLSQLAYQDEEEVAPIIQSLGYESTIFVSNDNAQCYFFESDDRIIIAIRGTEVSEVKDVMADLDFWKTDSKTHGGVHSGFYDDLEDLWHDISLYIGHPDRNDKKVWTCGHSLGGAMATLLASRLPFRIAACYTYGSPRVGDLHWAKKQRFVHHRYVNNNDIVPTVPPIFLNYTHYGELHYLNYYGNIRDLTAWQKSKDTFRGRLKAWSKIEFFDSIKDHAIDRYISKLQQQRQA